jgi:GNAT superfamily N-acetyltransferase
MARGHPGQTLRRSLDVTPLGRQDAWEDSPEAWPQVPTISWLRLHDEYEGATISWMGVPRQRLARIEDAPRIAELMRASVHEIFPRFYDARQTASAAVHLAALDMHLVEDGTYFVHEHEGDIVACGGWSRRNKLASGEGAAADDDNLLDPLVDPARVRMMFVRSDWTRRGLGRAILRSCELAAREAGFTRLVLRATLPGELLYRAFGFEEIKRFELTTPDGVMLECVFMERAIA